MQRKKSGSMSSHSGASTIKNRKKQVKDEDEDMI